MLHFIHYGEWKEEDSPFGAELKRLEVPHRFLSRPVNRRYHSHLELLLRIYPTLIWVALAFAVRSLVLSRPCPAAVVVSTDVDALIFGAFRRLLLRRTIIVFPTIIVTRKKPAIVNRVYMLYWRVIFSLIDLGICHSQAELDAYKAIFPRHSEKLAYVPYGISVDGRDALLNSGERGQELPTIVSAGRSGRDYVTLARAVVGLPCRLKIICDVDTYVADIPRSEEIEVLRDCFGGDYLRLIAGACFVVIPLSVDDISAGQMVFLQAAALGRPIIVTRTRTIVDYATDEEDALLVPMGDVQSLREAMLRLLADASLRARLGAAALQRFEKERSKAAYVRGLLAAIDRKLHARSQGS